ncbi:MAG: hypothetical protein M1825_000516 [Sarcosagium campestre]|nr:MAG: hypothetical protein M1825_000516 [Sarcosagium campestre]
MTNETPQTLPAFVNYPDPKLGPDVPYKVEVQSNPVVRGRVLSVLGSVVTSVGWLQNLLWSNAGFDGLRKLRELDNQDNRYDPTVIPIEDPSKAAPYPSSNTQDPDATTGISPGGYHTVAEYHALFKTGKLTPTAVAEALLPLIRRDVTPPGAHSTAFLDSKVEIILAAAAASTRRYKDGSPLGPLDGVPVAVKDEVDLTGYKKSLGSPRDFTSKDDGTSWCVQKWQEAGAVIMGKLTMHELGLDTTNNNPHYGTPLNPHNAEYYTGGSSGGSGYVVGAGLMPIALGADGGGSIRIPATYCGVFGLKPSHGRVSASPSVGIASSTGVIGPLASTMADLEIAYRVMAAPDPSNATSSLFPPPRPVQLDPRQKVLGVYTAWFDQADPAVSSACRAALAHLTSTKGYRLVDISIPLLPEGQIAHAMTILAEISTAIRTDTQGLTSANKLLISVGAKTPSTDFLLAQKLRSLLMRHLAALYKQHPGLIIVTPTTPNAGWPIAGGAADLKWGVSDANMSVRSMTYVWLSNFAGLPSLSVPVGYVDPAQGEGKIPLGFMGMGEWGSEDGLIEWGKDCEGWLNAGLEGGRQRPKNWVDLVELAAAKAGETKTTN